MTTVQVPPIEIHGYAIVSDDDKIAAADGLTPVSLRNEKDWDYYQRALANSDLIVLGRRSHEFEPNVRGDLRLVLSREGAGLEHRGDAWWWDSSRVSWTEAVPRILPNGGEVAVSGGQVAFDLFLAIGFEAFHLSRAKGVQLPGGRGVFAACDRGVPAETVLTDAGLSIRQTIPLDPVHGVAMTVWRMRKPAA
jgi:hypothetical protein